MKNFYLCIETSTTNCSVGLFQDEVLQDLQEVNNGYSHGELLAQMVKDVLAQNKMSVIDLQAVGVGLGPGSYTGLRIGVALAKGLCFNTSTKLIAVDSLQNMAQQVIENNQLVKDGSVLLSALDARRDEVYINTYNSDARATGDIVAMVIGEESFSDINSSSGIYAFGSGAEKLVRLSKKGKEMHFLENIFPSAKGMGKIIHTKYNNAQFEDIAYFEPLYLKEFIAGKPRKNALVP